MQKRISFAIYLEHNFLPCSYLNSISILNLFYDYSNIFGNFQGFALGNQINAVITQTSIKECFELSELQIRNLNVMDVRYLFKIILFLDPRDILKCFKLLGKLNIIFVLIYEYYLSF